MSEAMTDIPYYPSGSNVHASNMGALTDPEKAISLLREALSGMRSVNGKLIEISDPLMNDIGINSITSQLRSLVNQIAILSWLDDKDIRMLVHNQFGRNIIKDLMLNRKKYEITDPSARSKIVSMSQSIAYTTLRRALKGNDKNFWSRTQMEFSTNVHGGQDDGGLMSKVNLFRNR